jgi:hypothetical protein
MASSMTRRLVAAFLAALAASSLPPLAFAVQKSVTAIPSVAQAPRGPAALPAAAIVAAQPRVEARPAAGAQPLLVQASLPQAAGLADEAAKAPEGAADVPAFARAFDGADQAYERTRALRLVLSDGTDTPGGLVRPFGFRVHGRWYPARSAGLEGFLYSKLELENAFGAQATAGQLTDYFRYLEDLLAPYRWTANLRRRLDALKAAPLSAELKSERLNAILTAGVKAYQRGLIKADPSLWLREQNTYMIFARAYNRLKPGQDFFDSIDAAELERIKETTKAGVVWPLDIFEIGEFRRWGTGGGSSYSIKGYKIKPELGGEASFKRFVARAHAQNLKVAVDEIPNHVSLDSDLVKKHPEALLHMVPPQHLSDERILAAVPHHRGTPVFFLVKTDDSPADPAYRNKKILLHHPLTDFGGDMWIDMAQRDFSRKVTHDWEAGEMARIFRDWGIDMVRRDMAYEVLRDRYFDRWGKILADENARASGWARAEMEKMRRDFEWRRGELAGAEFLESTTRAIKRANRAGAAIDEVYGMADETSRTGSNGLYNKIDLYDAWVSRSSPRIREALRNISFRLYQKGGAAFVNFIGTHDGGEGNPFDKFGKLAKPIALMTLLLRPTLTFNGVEQGVGQALNVIGDLSRSVDRDKALPMDVPVAINWANADPEMQKFLRFVWAKADDYKRLMTRGATHVLEPRHDTPIQTFMASGFDDSGRRRTVLAAANISGEETSGVFDLPKNPVLRDFGAFRPRADKTYALRDLANPLPDGKPREYLRAGRDLIQHGLYIRLEAHGVHLFEIEERP